MTTSTYWVLSAIDEYNHDYAVHCACVEDALSNHGAL